MGKIFVDANGVRIHPKFVTSVSKVSKSIYDEISFSIFLDCMPDQPVYNHNSGNYSSFEKANKQRDKLIRMVKKLIDADGNLMVERYSYVKGDQILSGQRRFKE